METPLLILQTATRLFNEHGTARISTNHIAREAGISPGNLYYHFKDKAHIIREIYEEMIRAWEPVYEHAEAGAGEETLDTFIRGNFKMLWRYRFFYRENVALMQADPVLAAHQVEVNRKRFERQRALIREAARQGLLAFPDPDVQLDDVLTITWMIASHYLQHMEEMGRPVNEQGFEQGVLLLKKAIYPYLKR
jgi:AcrR family transcriptional regulator